MVAPVTRKRALGDIDITVGGFVGIIRAICNFQIIYLLRANRIVGSGFIRVEKECASTLTIVAHPHADRKTLTLRPLTKRLVSIINNHAVILANLPPVLDEVTELGVALVAQLDRRPG